METNLNHEMIHRLAAGSKEILLIGTAHVSQDSADLVKSVIEEYHPDTVCVELCPSRHQAITQKENWQNTDIVKIIREKKTFLLLSNLLLASFQKRIAKKLNVVPGQEMIAAMESAEAIGAGVHLADRDIRVTLSRTWRLMGFWGKMKLFYHLIMSIGDMEDISEEDVEKMKQEDVLESLLADVGQHMPVLKDILIDERDRYLTEKIRTAPGTKIVAVVGAGHVPGIKKYWETPIDLAALEVLPPKGKAGEIIQWLIPTLLVALVAWGFFRGGAHTGAAMVGWWVLATSGLSGLSAILVMAHPLTILSSIVAAPFTTIHPLIAVGWVAGLVEAFVRKPKVRDLESLSEDILSVRGFWRNKVTRILLVVVATNIGASIGTLLALSMIVKAA